MHAFSSPTGRCLHYSIYSDYLYRCDYSIRHESVLASSFIRRPFFSICMKVDHDLMFLEEIDKHPRMASLHFQTNSMHSHRSRTPNQSNLSKTFISNTVFPTGRERASLTPASFSFILMNCYVFLREKRVELLLDGFTLVWNSELSSF